MNTDSSALQERFDRDGYVIVRNLLDFETDLEPVVREYSEVLDRLARSWVDEGLLTSTHAGRPFCERLLQVVNEAKAPYDWYFDISLPQADITEQTPIHNGAAVFGLLRNPTLLDMVERFVGPEIYCNPVQHTRIKLPERRLPDTSRTGLTGQVAWHQDLGVITNEADDTETLTVWLPMTRATIENGCLAVLPGSHLDGLSHHCRSQNPDTLHQISIPDSLIDKDPTPLPMEPGDVLFMHRQTKHTGTPNMSDEVRWSFDLRYHAIGEPTGRPWFPGFVARSRAHPETELTDTGAWAKSWQEARAVLASSDDVDFNRWKNNDLGCA